MICAHCLSKVTGRWTALSVILVIFCLGCSREAERNQVSSTFTAIGTQEEVDKALAEAKGRKLDKEIRAELIKNGMTPEITERLAITATATSDRKADGESWLVLDVTWHPPVRTFSLDGTRYASSEFDLPVYYACRRIADDLFGRATRSIDPRPLWRRVAIRDLTEADQNALMAHIAGLLKGLPQKAADEGSVERPVEAKWIDWGEEMGVDFAEGHEGDVEIVVQSILAEVKRMGGRAEER